MFASAALIGSQVLIRRYEHELEIRDVRTLELIRRHTLAARKGEVKLPDAERVFNPSRQTHQILARAERLGPKTHQLCSTLFARRGREGQKAMRGIVALWPALSGLDFIEQAVATALLRQAPTYKAVRALADQ